MEVTYRYTDREYLQSRRINKLLGFPKWKSLGLALVCLLPSVSLVTFTFSFIAFFAFALVALFLIVMICWALIKQPKLSDKHDHLLSLTPVSLQEQSSHSKYELRWQYFDEFIENESNFQLRHLEKYILLPKRIFTPLQCEQLRRLVANVGAAMPKYEPPIPLFTKLFPPDGKNQVFRFTYRSEDLIQAATDPLQIIDASQSELTKNQHWGNWLILPWVATFVFVLFYWLRPTFGSSTQWSPVEYLVLAGVVILPFVLMLGMSRIIRARSAGRLPQVPSYENNLVLLSNGFAIGTPNNVTFYDWRDIDAFYQNGSCFGFRQFNDLIQVIPKRIFADGLESTDFINQAIRLHREYLRTFETAVKAVETGNPYQSPAN